MIALFLISLLSLSTFILFQTQSMIHLVAVFFAFIMLKKSLSRMEFRSLKKERIDWIATQFYYVFVKIWYTLLIRLWGIKLYKVLKFVLFVLHALKNWIKAANHVWKAHYIDNVRRNLLATLTRQETQLKNLTVLFERSRKNKRKLLLQVEIKKDNRHLVSWDWNELSNNSK